MSGFDHDVLGLGAGFGGSVGAPPDRQIVDDSDSAAMRCKTPTGRRRPTSRLGEGGGAPNSTWFRGGCTVGDSPRSGVADPRHRPHGCPGRHVVAPSMSPAAASSARPGSSASTTASRATTNCHMP